MTPRALFALSDMVDLPRVRRFVDGQHVSSPFGGARKHNGVDVRVLRGSPLYAPVLGCQVESVLRTPADRDGAGNGIAVIFWVPVPGADAMARIGIAHMCDISARIWHMMRHGNRRVTALRGEALGLSGSTGGSTGPHIHLTVTIEGAKVDPALWLDLDS